jgi:hypothetical protein
VKLEGCSSRHQWQIIEAMMDDFLSNKSTMQKERFFVRRRNNKTIHFRVENDDDVDEGESVVEDECVEVDDADDGVEPAKAGFVGSEVG